jgi:NADH-quinone oxidoreductase subunit C
MSDTPAPSATETAAPAVSIQNELARIRAAAPDAVLDVTEDPERGMFWVTVRPRAIQAVARALRDEKDCDFKLLTDLTCVDYPWEAERLNVIYNFYSISRDRRLMVRVRVADGHHVPTLSGIYASANWAEREVYDLFGVVFEGHPELTRILLPEEWEGHPLRKDYPTVGKRPVLLFNNVKDVL